MPDALPQGPHLSYERRDAVGLVRLDDPGTHNALDDDDVRALAEIVDVAAADTRVRVVMITGAGQSFCAGAHVAKMEELLDSDPAAVRASLAGWQQSLSALERLEKPVVAAVNGLCLAAGAALALACDIRVASESARIGFPSVRVGLVTDLGCSYRLPRIVGAGRALHHLLTGEWIDAAAAERMGLVTAVYPDEAFLDAALGFAAECLIPASVRAQGLMKRLVATGLGGGLEAALEAERSAQAVLYGSTDAREGYRSIVEKRPPRFAD